MRRSAILSTATAAVFILGLATGIGTLRSQEIRGQQMKTGPSVTVWPGVVELNANSVLVISGTGFRPNEPLFLTMQTQIGDGSEGLVINDVSNWLNPELIQADESGNFGGRFQMGTFGARLVEGVAGFTVRNADYTEILASTSVIFCDPRGLSTTGRYPTGAPNYAQTPNDPRPLPYCGDFFAYPERPQSGS